MFSSTRCLTCDHILYLKNLRYAYTAVTKREATNVKQGFAENRSSKPRRASRQAEAGQVTTARLGSGPPTNLLQTFLLTHPFNLTTLFSKRLQLITTHYSNKSDPIAQLDLYLPLPFSRNGRQPTRTVRPLSPIDWQRPAKWWQRKNRRASSSTYSSCPFKH